MNHAREPQRDPYRIVTGCPEQRRAEGEQEQRLHRLKRDDPGHESGRFGSHASFRGQLQTLHLLAPWCRYGGNPTISYNLVVSSP